MAGHTGGQATRATRRTNCVGLLALVLLLAAARSEAQAPQPLVHCVFPAGGQRGRTFEVTVNGDNDYFIFAAQQNQTLVMEVQARRRGSPLDSMLYLLNAQGGELSRNDEWVDSTDSLLTHHADSRIVYTFPAAGDYVLRIKDIQLNGGRDGPGRAVGRLPGRD